MRYAKKPTPPSPPSPRPTSSLWSMKWSPWRKGKEESDFIKNKWNVTLKGTVYRNILYITTVHVLAKIVIIQTLCILGQVYYFPRHSVFEELCHLASMLALWNSPRFGQDKITGSYDWQFTWINATIGTFQISALKNAHRQHRLCLRYCVYLLSVKDRRQARSW